MSRTLTLSLDIGKKYEPVELYGLTCEKIGQDGRPAGPGVQQNIVKVCDEETGEVTGFLIPYHEGDEELHFGGCGQMASQANGLFCTKDHVRRITTAKTD